MNLSLPKLPYRDKIQQKVQTQFGGLDYRDGAGDGSIRGMTNMSSDYYPILSPRMPRYIVSKLTKPNGIFGNDGLFTVDGTTVYKDGVSIGAVTDSKKTFAALGAVTVILPDKVFYNAKTSTFGSLEANTGAIATKIEDGTYMGESADANTIEYKGSSVSFDFADYFNPGDAVTIAGATTHTENNQTIIVREVTATKLVFYENSFVIGTGGDTETLTLSRTMPDLDFICENDNRLWGCKGDTIYASKLGDATNWNVYDGLSTDSYTVDVGTPADFTGCTSYLGYPIFFKDAHIYKVYGDKPANFEVVKSATLGVADGSSKSCAIAGETLFYLSRTGIVAYSGGVPTNISQVFGDNQYKNAVGGSDGKKYYVSMRTNAGAYWHLFVYDTRYGIWEREDSTQLIGTAWNDDLYMLASDGTIFKPNDCKTHTGLTGESTVSSQVVFHDFVENSPNKKHIAKLLIRYEVEAQSTFAVQIRYAGESAYTTVFSTSVSESGVDEAKRSGYLPIIPHRTDYFNLRISGTGVWRVYSLTREIAIGSQNGSLK